MTPLPRRIAAEAAHRPATLGSGRLVCIDGPAGSGKTTLADAVAEALGGAPVVHLDDLYPGWDGLPEVAARVLDLLGPLARDRPGRFRRYDWVAGAYAEEHVVAPGPWLVLEGVGAGQSAWAKLTTLLVWVEVADDLRLTRGIARDGEGMRLQWLRWMGHEQAHFARDATRARADVHVDGASAY